MSTLDNYIHWLQQIDHFMQTCTQEQIKRPPSFSYPLVRKLYNRLIKHMAVTPWNESRRWNVSLPIMEDNVFEPEMICRLYAFGILHGVSFEERAQKWNAIETLCSSFPALQEEDVPSTLYRIRQQCTNGLLTTTTTDRWPESMKQEHFEQVEQRISSGVELSSLERMIRQALLFLSTFCLTPSNEKDVASLEYLAHMMARLYFAENKEAKQTSKESFYLFCILSYLQIQPTPIACQSVLSCHYSSMSLMEKECYETYKIRELVHEWSQQFTHINNTIPLERAKLVLQQILSTQESIYKKLQIQNTWIQKQKKILSLLPVSCTFVSDDTYKRLTSSTPPLFFLMGRLETS